MQNSDGIIIPKTKKFHQKLAEKHINDTADVVLEGKYNKIRINRTYLDKYSRKELFNEAVNMKLTEPEASKETKLRNVNMPDSEVYNEFLSGIYYSTGCRYIYDSAVGFTTELVLSKRDWVPNPEI